MYVTMFKSLIIEFSVIDFADESIILLYYSKRVYQFIFKSNRFAKKFPKDRKKSMEKLFFSRFY